MPLTWDRFIQELYCKWENIIKNSLILYAGSGTGSERKEIRIADLLNPNSPNPHSALAPASGSNSSTEQGANNLDVTQSNNIPDQNF